ncbi:MAG: AAA family ATPase, partial [Candidatus Competibacteraceae bacterium]|nr:AAA family ATPase [Candidatus Competibacteraceae bacterium]
MLVHLQIRNFAIIDQLELDFAAGMSAITGETGAGKSIAVDALSLLLGDRADSSVIRHGAKSAELCALFDVSALAPVQKWLQERELMPPDTVPDATGLEC